MATQLEKKPAAAAKGASRVDQFVGKQLQKTTQQLRVSDIFTGIIALVSFVIAFFLGAAIIDAWVLAFSPTLRLLMLACLLIGTATLSWIFVLPFFYKRINPQYAAKMIEDAKPEFKNSILNYLSLKGRNQKVHKAILNEVSRKAATDLTQVTPDSAVDKSNLIRAGFLLVGLAALAVGYAILSPKSPLPTILRILSPGSKISKPAAVSILEVTPGDTSVFFGDRPEITAKVMGIDDNEEVRLVYSSKDSQILDAVVPMQSNGPGGYFSAKLVTGPAGIQQPLYYHIEAGDGESPVYSINVRPNPTITIEQIKITPPKYTRLSERVIEGTGEIQAVEGSKVEITAKANLPIELAYIVPLVAKSNAANENSYREMRSIQMLSDMNSAVGRITAALNSNRDRAQFTHYKINFRSKDNFRNEQPNIYPIRVIADLAPEIQIVEPAQREVTIPTNQPLSIQVWAADLDYEISSLDVQIDHNGRKVFEQNLFRSSKPQKPGQRISGNLSVTPADLRLKPGDTAILFATAADNRISSTSELLDPNVTRSENYTLLITEPIENPDSQKSDEQNKQEQQEKNQQQNEEQKSSEENQDGEGDGQGSEGESDDGTGDGEEGAGDGNEGDDAAEDGSERQQGDQDGSQGEQGGSEQKESEQSEGTGSDNSDQSESSSAGSEGDSESESQSQQQQNPDNGQSDSRSNGKGSDSQPSGGDNQEQAGNEESQAGSSKGDSSDNADQSERADQNSNGDSGNNNSSSQSADQNTNGQERAGNEGGNQDATSQEPSDGQSNSDSGARRDGNSQSSDRNANKGNDNDGGQSDNEEFRDENLTEGETEPLHENASEGEQFERLKEYFDEKEKAAQEQRQANPDSNQDTQEQQQDRRAPAQSDRPDSQPGASNEDQSSDSQNPQSAQSQDGQQQDPQGNPSDSDPSQQQENPSESSDGQSTEQPSESQTSKSQEQSNQSGNSSTSNSEGDSPESESESSSDSPSQSGAQSDSQPGGEQNQQPGGEDQGNNQSQQAQPGQGNESQNSTGQNQSDTGSEPGESQGSEQPESSSQSSSNSDSQTKEMKSSGTGGNDSPKSSNEEISPASPDKANLDYTKKVTDLVLDQLEDQQLAPDQELLDQMNWSQEDLNNFVKQWQRMKQKAQTGDVKAKRTYEDALRAIGLSPKSKARKVDVKKEKEFILNEDGAVDQIPTEYRDKFNSFLKRRNRSKR